MLTVNVIDKEYSIYGQFTREVLIEEVGDNYFIFKGSKAYEYGLFYKYEPGASDTDLILTTSTSFDGINYYDVNIFSRKLENDIMVDRPYPLNIIIPKPTETITGYYILTLPAVIEYCKINIDGLVDGTLDILVGVTK